MARRTESTSFMRYLNEHVDPKNPVKQFHSEKVISFTSQRFHPGPSTLHCERRLLYSVMLNAADQGFADASQEIARMS